MDSFASLFSHATPTARTFFTGTLCQGIQFADGGYLHLLKAGTLTLARNGETDVVLTEPTLMFFPRERVHRFVVDAERGADLVCASVELGNAEGNPIGQGLPEMVILPISAHPALAPVCELLLGEAFSERDGKQVALDRLFDYLLILIVRHVVRSGAVPTGVLAGLAEPRLARALTAMHDLPQKPWTLDALADTAGMSRTRFAEQFRAVVGRTPLDYLTSWRMTIARRLLSRGKPVKSVAAQVGYTSAAAFTRVFSRIAGQSPREVEPLGTSHPGSLNDCPPAAR